MNISEDAITTLVDHRRAGLFVFAFCPVCDHAEETKDIGRGHEQTAADSIAKIRQHIHKVHRAKSAKHSSGG